MRFVIFCFLAAFSSAAIAQTHSDSVQFIRNSVKLYDLDFTEAEADSMMGTVYGRLQLYKAMHKTLPTNDIPFPFAFHPLPFGKKVPSDQKKVVWDIPKTMQLPAKKNELSFYSIMQLASLVKNKKITSVDLTKFFLERLKKWGDTLKSVITITEDTALKQAAQADEEIKKGIYRGPLHGIPYGLKDLFAVKGYKTTWGSTPYKDQELDYNSFVYEQLKKAGAVLCAKLSMGALAQNNKWFGGDTKNPWNLKQGSSGSSAGSASSVAAGLLPFTVGTETQGSIVSPSAVCGATGLRPTFGSISRSGAMVLSWSLDKAGPICRSAEDDAIVFYYLKGTDGKDASAVDHAFNYNPKIDLTKLKIAYAENYFKRLAKDAAEWKVIDVYKALGAKVQATTFPDSAIYPNNFIGLILSAESAAAFDELTRTNRDDLVELQTKGFWPNTFRSARMIPAVEYINANRYRYNLCRDMYDFMKDWDIVIFPTSVGRQISITNLTGNPVVCFPAGFTAAGNPLSITLVGKLYDEATILAAAKAYQDKTDFNKQHPAKFMN
jgi:Asp-tRNA(Asn)/Glu-tRNA(Gln) amidotransferase A subunit family amidase